MNTVTFDALYSNLYRQLVRYCCYSYKTSQSDAEDIVDEAFAQLWTAWDNLDSHGEIGLFVWIKKAVDHLCFAHNKRHQVLSLDSDLIYSSHLTDGGLPVDDLVCEDEIYRIYLSQILSRLTKKQCRLFECIVLQHLDIIQTAKHLNAKENSVRVAWKRLRRKLRSDILPDILGIKTFESTDSPLRTESDPSSSGIR